MGALDKDTPTPKSVVPGSTKSDAGVPLTGGKGAPVTLAQAKSLGFNSTVGITIKDGQYIFDPSLAPTRGGFQPVGMAKPGQVQMSPYYADVTGTYRLNQEQYAAIRAAGGDISEGMLKAMSANEQAAIDKRISELKIQLKSENPGWWEENINSTALEMAYNEAGKEVPRTAIGGGYNAAGVPTPGGQYNASGTFVGGTSGTSGSAAGSALGGTTTGGTTAAQQASRAATTTALEDFRANLRLAGLESLADKIDQYIKDDLTPAQVKINIVGTEEYKKRFPGMEALAKAGKAITEKTYIDTERAFDTVLRAHGLDTKLFGTTEQYGKYITNQVSPVEFENRVSIAADRVNKNADVLAALNNYYGVDKGAAISYLLDPKLGMDLVQKQARAAEIGAAAAASGFSFGEGQVGAGVAESFVNAAGTEDLQTLKVDFGKARQMATTQGRLAQIEGENYRDLDAITAVLAQDQAQIMQSQRRAAREVARFSGSGGTTGASLRRETSI